MKNFNKIQNCNNSKIKEKEITQHVVLFRPQTENKVICLNK